MESLWPWFTAAGLGALHGLNPATGWALATAWGVHERDRSLALRGLLPIALGHAASVALVAVAVALGLALDRMALQVLAGGLLVVVVALHLRGPRVRKATGHAGLALWSFIMSSAHGAGLMLVPALIPLCLGNAQGQAGSASGSLMLALAAVGVHGAAMLAVTGLVAIGACRAFDAAARWLLSSGPGTSGRLMARPLLRATAVRRWPWR
jgi:hypothetical protein